MGECFLPLAHDLGYRASFFNLVFVTNKVTVKSSICLFSTWMSKEQKFPHLDKNVLKTYQLRESLIPPINWGSTQETDQLNILSKQHFCQMGLELRPNLKLPMHTSLFCFEGQRPLVERAGLHTGKSFQILSHLKTNWSDSLSIFFLFS